MQKRLFPEIKNREPFINNDHPVLLPDTVEYDEYWDREQKRCIEGFWAEETPGNWRYMPPTLYWMINQWPVILEGGEGVAGRRIGKAFLRDVEWIIHTDWLVCRGFYGFHKGETTGHPLVKKYERFLREEVDDDGVLVRLSKIEEKKLNQLKFVKNSKGEFKKWEHPLDIVKKTYSEDLGLPLYSKEEGCIHNYLLLSGRGNGKSLSCGAICGHELTFDGRQYYQSDLDTGERGSGEIFVGAPETKKMRNLLGYVKTGLENLYGEYDQDGIYEQPPFSKKWTGSWGKDKGDIVAQYEKVVGGKRVSVSSGTNAAYGTFTVANPDAAVSNRRTIIVCDEIGLASNIEQVHGANVNVMSNLGRKYGSSFYAGTGGSMEKMEGCKGMFYNPRQYNILPFDDIWEGRGEIGRFIPAEYSLQDYKDDQGNTILDEASEALEKERKRLSKADSNLPLVQKKMYMPMKPSEMFISLNSNLFPIDKLQDQLVKAEDEYSNKVKQGWLEYVGQGRQDVKWVPNMNPNRKPLHKLKTDSFVDLGGIIEVSEHPPVNLPERRNYRSLYKITYDPVSDDEGGSSLACICVWKGFAHDSWEQGVHNQLVGFWIGRFDKTEEIHELAIKMALYFGAKILFESNVQEFYKWARKNGVLHLLQPTLPGISSKTGYGIKMTKELIREGELALRNTLIEHRDLDEDDNKILNLHFIWFPRILNELIAYSRDGNFDAVSSLLLLGLWIASEREGPIMKKDENRLSRAKEFKSLLYSNGR